jgi:ABC-type multidrug transport system fused ATPase/permease subunit
MDSELETALFSAIRLPTVLAPLDYQAEKVSLRILNALSSFENIAEMPEETTIRILLNDALRQKLALEKDVATQIELVKEVLIEENRKAEERVIAEKNRNMEMQQQSKTLEERLTKSIESEKELQSALQKALAREKATKEENDRLIQLERERVNSQIILRKSRRSRILFATEYIISLIACLCCYFEAQRSLDQHMVVALVEVFVLAVWAFFFWRQGSRSVFIRDWTPFQLVMKFKFWLAVTIIGGIIGNGAWAQFQKAIATDNKSNASHQVQKDGK